MPTKMTVRPGWRRQLRLIHPVHPAHRTAGRQYTIADPRNGTLVRHFLLAPPQTMLTAGMEYPAPKRVLVAAVGRPPPLTARRGGAVRPTIALTPIALAADEKHHAATRAKTLTGGNVHDQARQKKPTSPWTFTRKRLDTVRATVLARPGTVPGKRRSDRRCCACSLRRRAFVAQIHGAVIRSVVLSTPRLPHVTTLDKVKLTPRIRASAHACRHLCALFHSHLHPAKLPLGSQKHAEHCTAKLKIA